jgi:hypothetical protein
MSALEMELPVNDDKVVLDQSDFKSEARNPKFETISNGQISNV